MRSRRSHRWLATLAVLLPLALPATAATAATKVGTTISLHAAAGTVHVGSTTTISGAVKPVVKGERLTVQSLVGKTWKTVTHTSPTASGAYTLAVKVPAAQGVWALRVARDSKGAVKAGVSRTVALHVVKAIYRVTATPAVGAGNSIVVTGTVSPKATGSVSLQRLVGKVWHTLSSARLSATSTFSVATTQPPGSYALRVSKAFSSKVAAGVSKTLAVTVATPPPALVVTTASLPNVLVGQPYAQTLTAVGGVAPYTWSVSSGTLPTGLTLSAAGVLAGRPVTAGPLALVVKVTDAAGTARLQPLTFAVTPTTVHSWGLGTYGALGNGGNATLASPAAIGGLTNAVSISAGYVTAYAVAADGTVWAWGDNGSGQLGIGSHVPSNVPVQVPGLTGVTAVAGGQVSGYALKSDGTVWAWGLNDVGQLGTGDQYERDLPVQVSGVSNIVQIAASLKTGYALRADGTVWAWGDNGTFELGDNDIHSAYGLLPVQVFNMTGDGVLTAVTSIAATNRAALALLSNGTVAVWGADSSGEDGAGPGNYPHWIPHKVTTVAGATAIAAGATSAYALLADGTVISWGSNTVNQLANGRGVDSQPVPTFPVVGLSGVVKIAASGSGGMALTSDGSLWTWGDNSAGQLGQGIAPGGSSGTPAKVAGLTGVRALAGAAQSVYALTG